MAVVDEIRKRKKGSGLGIGKYFRQSVQANLRAESAMAAGLFQERKEIHAP